MVINMWRIIRHLLSPPWRARRAFPKQSLRTIEAVIRKAEETHQGQVRFVVETALEFLPLLRDQPARERAIEVFSQLRIWDTEQNNGVLIYLLLADHDVEIVADRGIYNLVGKQGLELICLQMEAAFKQKRFEEGVVAGIQAVSEHLARHYPGQSIQLNELPDVPIVL